MKPRSFLLFKRHHFQFLFHTTHILNKFKNSNINVKVHGNRQWLHSKGRHPALSTNNRQGKWLTNQLVHCSTKLVEQHFKKVSFNFEGAPEKVRKLFLPVTTVSLISFWGDSYVVCIFSAVIHMLKLLYSVLLNFCHCSSVVKWEKITMKKAKEPGFAPRPWQTFEKCATSMKSFTVWHLY